MASFELPTSKMSYKGIPGAEVAARILEAQKFAEKDQFRATTHNKGIMNGIDAVAVAAGQDWRALESAAHSYTALSGKYLPLTSYCIEGDLFKGSIELPLAVGTYGGAINSNPEYANFLKILGNPTGSELSQVMAAVGLA